MTLIRLYRIHRRGGRDRMTALRLALGSIRRDRETQRLYRAALRKAQRPFCDSRN